VRGLLGWTLALVIGLGWHAASAWAVGVDDLPAAPPTERVLDTSAVLSRAAAGEIESRLQSLQSERVDARLVTVDRLDYGIDLGQLGDDLLERWSGSNDGAPSLPRLLLLIDTHNRTAAIAASPSLEKQLPPQLLRSTARTTMALPLREGARYRQSVLDGLDRLGTVLQGGEDPGEPVEPESAVVVSNVPTRQETQESNAFTWVVVLLVVGSVVPMVTWWVFSR
jgi:uncharacterized protein